MGILFHLHRVRTGDALLRWMILPSLKNFSDPIPHLFVAPLTRGSNSLWKGRKNVADRDLRDEGMTSFPGTGRGLREEGPIGSIHLEPNQGTAPLPLPSSILLSLGVIYPTLAPLKENFLVTWGLFPTRVPW